MRYKKEMLDALKAELRMRRDYLEGIPIGTIYFGGGTPSLLSVDEVSGLLSAIRDFFVCREDMEVTLEGNPDNLSFSYLKGLRGVGVNRLSIGVQSINGDVLASLNRSHKAKAGPASIMDARKAGFTNFSIDLMYGLPARKAGTWAHELAEVVCLAPPHISAYCLTIEPNTVFGHRRARGTFVPVDEAQEVAEFMKLKEVLGAAGYVHYEISNFCLAPHYARHNTNYWQGGLYLGVGPSAHSYDGRSRQYNVAHNKAYIDSIIGGSLPLRQEVLRSFEHVNEHIMLGLRTMWGCDTALLKRMYGYDLFKEREKEITFSMEKGWMVRDGDHLVLTERGQLLADEIAKDLFCDEGTHE